MATSCIDTLSLPRRDLGLQGEVAEILNRELCGAENVLGALRGSTPASVSTRSRSRTLTN